VHRIASAECDSAPGEKPGHEADDELKGENYSDDQNETGCRLPGNSGPLKTEPWVNPVSVA
jgi:hypothetical protein